MAVICCGDLMKNIGKDVFGYNKKGSESVYGDGGGSERLVKKWKMNN